MLRNIVKYISKVNKSNVESFQALRSLRGDNIFDTFLNVKSFNNLQEVKKDVKSLKMKFEKLPQGLSKERRKQIKTMRKAGNKVLQAPFFQAIKDAEKLKRGEMDVKVGEIRQSIFEERLKLKQKQGKSISYFDTLQLNNPKLRTTTKFLATKIYPTVILNLLDSENIRNANQELGFGAAAEEVGKNTTMTFLGLTALKYANTQLKNSITSLSLYCPAGRFFKVLSFPSALLLSLTVKPILDKLWVTEYEKMQGAYQQEGVL